MGAVLNAGIPNLQLKDLLLLLIIHDILEPLKALKAPKALKAFTFDAKTPPSDIHYSLRGTCKREIPEPELLWVIRCFLHTTAPPSVARRTRSTKHRTAPKEPPNIFSLFPFPRRKLRFITTRPQLLRFHLSPHQTIITLR